MLNNRLLNILQTVFALYYVMLIFFDKFENVFKFLIELFVRYVLTASYALNPWPTISRCRVSQRFPI